MSIKKITDLLGGAPLRVQSCFMPPRALSIRKLFDITDKDNAVSLLRLAKVFSLRLTS